MSEILNFLQDRLAAHEGGAPSISIGYDDATFNYIISQKKGFRKEAPNKILGCSRSLTRAFELAISGQVYDA